MEGEALALYGCACGQTLTKIPRQVLDCCRTVGITRSPIECPRCGMVSHHPDDIANGYCGKCHWWTSDPLLSDVDPTEVLALKLEIAGPPPPGFDQQWTDAVTHERRRRRRRHDARLVLTVLVAVLSGLVSSAVFNVIDRTIVGPGASAPPPWDFFVTLGGCFVGMLGFAWIMDRTKWRRR